IRPDSLDAFPSTPRPTTAPASSSERTGAVPDPSRPFDVGQCATPVPEEAIRSTAADDRCTQCASHTSGPSQPSDSAYSTGVIPYRSWQYDSSSLVSARCVCSRTPSDRASDAQCRISSPVTVNGEHG